MYQNPLEQYDFLTVASLLRQKPHAVIRLTGEPVCPILRGIVRLYPMPRGVLLAVEVGGLPEGPLFDLTLEGDLPLPSLLAHRGQALQVMLVGGCTVEDLMGRTMTLWDQVADQPLGKGKICP